MALWQTENPGLAKLKIQVSKVISTVLRADFIILSGIVLFSEPLF